MNVSGRLLVLSILAIAFSAAGLSWWVRYRTTHQAAQFWHPQATLLIRDAPLVEALRLVREDAGPAASALAPNDPTGDHSGPGIEVQGLEYVVSELRDVSRAPGMLHLRNALLESRSYVWDQARDPPGNAGGSPPTAWAVGLRFSDPGQGRTLTILFSDNFRWLMRLPGQDGPAATIQSAPIADKLATMFEEFLAPQPVGR